jgi:hypothetical protein
MTSIIDNVSAFRYRTDIGFEKSKAYKYISKALNIKLKSNTHEYKCADYELSLDFNMAFVYFKEPNMTYIREIMHKIADALSEDKDCWSLYDDKCDCEIDINAESYEPEDHDDNESLRGADITEEEANEILEEYKMEEEEKLSKEALNAKKMVYTPKEYNGYSREAAQYYNTVGGLINRFNDDIGINDKAKIIIDMYQYIIANTHIVYNDLPQNKANNVNKTVQMQIEVSKRLKLEVISNSKIDSDLAADAIHILTWAHDHLQGLYDKNNTV